MNNSPKIGVFGGTFDPPHIGHLILASEACVQFKLDHVLWVLTPDPPHKQMRSITPLEHRLAMVQLAIDEIPIFKLSYVDLRRSGPYYAVDTLEIISEQNKGADLVYLVGSDLLQSFPYWVGSTTLVSKCHLIGVARRSENSFELNPLEKTIPGVTSKIRFVNIPLMDISSSDIRVDFAKGCPFQDLLPSAVYKYIEDHRLYR